ncbi:Uncharacterized protein FWK35_00000670 [Aphis craccivora]|uniref:THAP-type domain-containing protein n=1 Tax=Aphis craccivora TaxID=307492 RepID=A0A6G0ZQZ8_APHCR|nr:Uncharacterized protein FWK35_00000670 [Aphis craccivora]
MKMILMFFLNLMLVLKSLGEKVPKKYSPAIRQFALSLHFFCPPIYANPVLCLTKWLFDNILNFVIQKNNAWCYGGIYKSGLELVIGYFFTSNLTSMQKAELIKQALYLLKATGIRAYDCLVCLTLYSCSTNLTMALILGCHLNIETNIVVELSDKETENNCLFLDPDHMIELVRNTFGEKKIFQHINDYIKFDFIGTLFMLHEQVSCHLANNKKINVKLATQLLSKSVENAMRFCKNK